MERQHWGLIEGFNGRVKSKSTTECFKEIPVYWKNDTKYVNPRTRIIQDLGSPIPCSTIMNTYIKEQNIWYKLYPYIHEISAPIKLSTNINYNYTYKSFNDYISGGIYSQEVDQSH